MPLDNADSNYQNHIPEAVRRASAKADELAQAQNAPSAEEPPVEESVAPPAPVVVPAEPVAPPVQPEAPAQPSIDWEQRYRSLQGKYDSEIPRLNHELSQMRQILANLQAAPAPAQPATSTTVVVPPEDASEYGEDLITAARRWARAELQEEINGLRSEVSELRGGHQNIQAQTVQQRVEAGLNADPEIGNRWRALNNDPEFLAWLSRVDPFAGHPRIEMLRDAAGRGDVDRCARFFRAYVTEHTAVSQPAPMVATQTPAAPVASARPSLEDLAAPGRGSGPVPVSGASEKRMWTRNEITRFYNDVRKGRYAGRDADMRRIEHDIIAASTEGRIHQQ